MKRSYLLSVLLSAVCAVSVQAQPSDLSFLTNRAALASWAMKQVNQIGVELDSSAAGEPGVYGGFSVSFEYSGPASLTSMARSVYGYEVSIDTPLPQSSAYLRIDLNGVDPLNGGIQTLFNGGVSGKPIYDGRAWRLPKDSVPEIRLSPRIAIPVEGLLGAWVVETNAGGWAAKKMLYQYDKGFYFDSNLAGEVQLCLEVNGKGGPTTWVYDLKSDGKKRGLSKVIASVLLKDSDDVRDLLNPGFVSHWSFAYQPLDSTRVYGIVPLLIATFEYENECALWVGSKYGYATSYKVIRMADKFAPERTSEAIVPPGQQYVMFHFIPGVYHIIPLGMDLCSDWWIIDEVYGQGKG